MSLYTLTVTLDQRQTQKINELMDNTSLTNFNVFAFNYTFKNGTVACVEIHGGNALGTDEYGALPYVQARLSDENECSEKSGSFWGEWTFETDTDEYQLKLIPSKPFNNVSVIEDDGNVPHIRVRVKGGFLDAMPFGDLEYPGIDIEYEPDEKSDEDIPSKTYPRVLMEWPNDEKHPHAVAWTDAESENYTDKIVFCNDAFAKRDEK